MLMNFWIIIGYIELVFIKIDLFIWLRRAPYGRLFLPVQKNRTKEKDYPDDASTTLSTIAFHALYKKQENL